MPIYEYTCLECECSFELLIREGEVPSCPECSSPRLRRKFSTFMQIHSPSSRTSGSSCASCSGGNCAKCR